MLLLRADREPPPDRDPLLPLLLLDRELPLLARDPLVLLAREAVLLERDPLVLLERDPLLLERDPLLLDCEPRLLLLDREPLLAAAARPRPFADDEDRRRVRDDER